MGASNPESRNWSREEWFSKVAETLEDLLGRQESLSLDEYGALLEEAIFSDDMPGFTTAWFMDEWCLRTKRFPLRFTAVMTGAKSTDPVKAFRQNPAFTREVRDTLIKETVEGLFIEDNPDFREGAAYPLRFLKNAFQVGKKVEGATVFKELSLFLKQGEGSRYFLEAWDALQHIDVDENESIKMLEEFHSYLNPTEAIYMAKHPSNGPRFGMAMFQHLSEEFLYEVLRYEQRYMSYPEIRWKVIDKLEKFGSDGWRSLENRVRQLLLVTGGKEEVERWASELAKWKKFTLIAEVIPWMEADKLQTIPRAVLAKMLADPHVEQKREIFERLKDLEPGLDRSEGSKTKTRSRS